MFINFATVQETAFVEFIHEFQIEWVLYIECLWFTANFG